MVRCGPPSGIYDAHARLCATMLFIDANEADKYRQFSTTKTHFTLITGVESYFHFSWSAPSLCLTRKQPKTMTQTYIDIEKLKWT